MARTIFVSMAVLLSAAMPSLAKTPAVVPLTVTDYDEGDWDEGDWYLVRGNERRSYHGMRESWIFNRAMVWLDESSGMDGTLLCYSSRSPLPLSGKKQVSRWYAGPGNGVTDVDDYFTRLTKRNVDSTRDHVCLPPFQFQIEQHSTAEFEVHDATHPWQFVAVIKERSGPPLFASPWQTGPGKLTVNLLELYRKKGFDATRHFAEMVFFVAVWTEDPEQQATVVFRLSLTGSEVVGTTLLGSAHRFGDGSHTNSALTFSKASYNREESTWLLSQSPLFPPLSVARYCCSPPAAWAVARRRRSSSLEPTIPSEFSKMDTGSPSSVPRRFACSAFATKSSRRNASSKRGPTSRI